MGKLIRLYEENTNERLLREVVNALDVGAIVIYPTDTMYALGCSLNNIKAISKIKKIKQKDNDSLSLICNNISAISDYAKVDNAQYRLIKQNTPGPFTFILTASGSVPNKFLDRKSNVGIRIPDNAILLQIIEMLGCPLVSTSLPISSLDECDSVNSELIWEEYRDIVDIIIDGGEARLLQSTVVDLSSGEIDIIRQGYKELIV